MSDRRGRRRASWCALLSVLLVLGSLLVAPAPVALAASFSVTTTADSGSGSLRAAIQAANDSTDAASTITFALGAGPQVVELTTGALPAIAKNLTVTGPGSALLTVQRSAAPTTPDFRLLSVAAGTTVEISGLTLANGVSHGASGDGGGLLYNAGTLTLTDVVLTGGTADNDGGAVFNAGTLTLNNSAVTNSTAVQGGGVLNNTGATLTLTDSSVTGNSARLGGAVLNAGVLNGSGTTFQSNHAVDGQGGGAGGALYNFSPSATSSTFTQSLFADNDTDGVGGAVVSLLGGLAFSAVTFTDNQAVAAGGAILFGSVSPAVLTLNSSTIAGNSAAVIGGLGVDGSASLSNTILANNSGGDCSGTLASLDYNLIEDTTDCSLTGATTHNLTGQDPMLDALADRGGLTDTLALRDNSPALEAGNPATPGSAADACSATDQRGVTRPQPAAGRCDIGAFELDVTQPVVVCAAPDGLWHAADVTLACTASDAGAGLANPADASFTLTTNVPDGTESANASTDSRSVCDLDNNCASAGPIAGNMVDKQAPSITITTPLDGGAYDRNALVVASYACIDGGSGVATCVGSVPNGAPLDTSTLGAHTFTVSSTDALGHSASRTISYGVGASMHVAGIAILSATCGGVPRACRTAGVKIQSQGGNVRNAGVTLRVTQPDQTTQTLNATTNTQGIASFTLTTTQPGLWTVAVVNVVATNLTYAPNENSVTSQTFTITPSRW